MRQSSCVRKRKMIDTQMAARLMKKTSSISPFGPVALRIAADDSTTPAVKKTKIITSMFGQMRAAGSGRKPLGISFTFLAVDLLALLSGSLSMLVW